MSEHPVWTYFSIGQKQFQKHVKFKSFEFYDDRDDFVNENDLLLTRKVKVS